LIEIAEDCLVTVNVDYHVFLAHTVHCTLISARQPCWLQISLWWVNVRLCVSPQDWTSTQLPQRDRAAEWISFGQRWNTGTGRRYFADIGLSLTTMT